MRRLAIHAISHDVLSVNAGSLYPAHYRLEARDLIRAEWEESKTGRRVKVYSVTAAGRKALAEQRTSGHGSQAHCQPSSK